MGHAQILVEVPCLSDLPVHLVDGVKKVCEDDKNVDAPSILVKAWRARLRLGFASTYPDSIEC